MIPDHDVAAASQLDRENDECEGERLPNSAAYDGVQVLAKLRRRNFRGSNLHGA